MIVRWTGFHDGYMHAVLPQEHFAAERCRWNLQEGFAFWSSEYQKASLLANSRELNLIALLEEVRLTDSEPRRSPP